MPYRLKGTLKAPNGQPLTGVDLQLIAQQTLSPVLQQTDHNIRLGADGSYDVSLEFNIYAVKAHIGGLAPQHMGYIKVDVDTPAGLDLPQLLRSYSQEATAPDYAKMIEGWLKEAKAAADTATTQATSAKAQADRAKTEADRASQITGLDTVADAIGLAAVPFPDVWVPFNDSLRMLAGFGRDVKVGADVVATYVNYERATTATYTDKSGVLRTAAINEPRFEKEGLLIEGQSTNYITHSTVGGGGWATVEGLATITHDGDYSVITKTSSQRCSIQTLIQHSTLGSPTSETECTISFDLKNTSLGIDTGKFIVVQISNWGTNEYRSQIFPTFSQSDGRVSAKIDIPAGMNVFRVQVRLDTKSQVGDKITIGRMQFEALPFASSYIPTNGAAVTRAADKITIPRLNNECIEWYSGADKITPKINADTIEFSPPEGKTHLRNVKGFFTPLTEAQKKGLK